MTSSDPYSPLPTTEKGKDIHSFTSSPSFPNPPLPTPGPVHASTYPASSTAMANADPDAYGGFATGKRVNKRKESLTSILRLLKSLLLPIIAAAYLAFCYTVQNRVIVLDTNRLVQNRPQELAVIKSGITSISILVISIGLWPLKSLITDLLSEEFFRTLSTHPAGVPLETVNAISSPSMGARDSLLAIIRQRCSAYFTGAFVAGFLAIAVSTLAPAALSIETVLLDDDMMAFPVGAIDASSVINTSASDLPLILDLAGTTGVIYNNIEQASSISWAENSLDLQFSFKPSYPDSNTPFYVVPVPAGLSTTTTARWITDVIAFRPTCDWARTNLTSEIRRTTNLTTDDEDFYLNLPDHGMDIKFRPRTLSANTAVLDQYEPMFALNASNADPISDGSSLWVISYCQSGCTLTPEQNAYVSFNIASPLRIVGADRITDFAILVCSPHPQIETREIRNNGRGLLSVLPLSTSGPLPAQNNINFAQANFLLSIAMREISEKGGPAYAIHGLGTSLQATMIFGRDQVAKTNTTAGLQTWTPQPVETIAQSYGSILESVTKTFMSGLLGTAYVPGRTSHEVLVFTSSRAHVAISTVLFAILALGVVVAHWRKGQGEIFTLSSVAATMWGSHVPQEMVQLRRETQGLRIEEEKIVEPWGGRNVVLSQRDDGTRVIVMN